MPKYLFHGSYTQEGLKGFLKEGGSKRREATKQMVESAGGTLEAYYSVNVVKRAALHSKLRQFYGIRDL
jgi:uncharacterized protein with GYD domain